MNEEKFWASVDKTPGHGPYGFCWLWARGKYGGGYGRANLNGAKERPAHRIAYALLIEEPSPHLDLDHLCRVRACVNPAHLEPVTRKENLRRGETIPAAHARKTHCPRGHAYAGENLFMRTGSRQCRECTNARDRARRPPGDPKSLAVQKAYREKNREELKAKKRAAWARDKGAINAARRAARRAAYRARA